MVKRKRRPKKLAELPIHNHLLMRKHTKLSETEKKALLKQYNTDTTELPKIRVDDPAINKLSVESGDIIKIVRQSKTAGVSIAYRVVIDLI